MGEDKTVKYTNIELLRVVIMILLIFHHYQALSGCVFSLVNFYGNEGWSYGYLTEIFFMVSGFMIARKESAESFKTYMKERIKRIYPFAVISSLFYLIITIIYYFMTESYMFEERYLVMQVIASFLLMDRGWIIDFTPAFNAPIWYVDVLMLCYVMYFWAEWIGRKYKLNRLVIPLIIVGASCILNYINLQFPFMWSSNKRGYISFFMGVMIVELYKCLRKRMLVLGVWGGIAMYVLMVAALGKFNYYGMVVFLYPSIVLLLLVLPQINGKLPEFGKAQFQAYLWNVPIYRCGVLLSAALGITVKHSYFTMILFACLIEIMAYAFFNRIEIPIRRFLEKCK